MPTPCSKASLLPRATIQPLDLSFQYCIGTILVGYHIHRERRLRREGHQLDDHDYHIHHHRFRRPTMVPLVDGSCSVGLPRTLVLHSRTCQFNGGVVAQLTMSSSSGSLVTRHGALYRRIHLLRRNFGFLRCCIPPSRPEYLSRSGAPPSPDNGKTIRLPCAFFLFFKWAHR
jgi:hypothetical protein